MPVTLMTPPNEEAGMSEAVTVAQSAAAEVLAFKLDRRASRRVLETRQLDREVIASSGAVGNDRQRIRTPRSLASGVLARDVSSSGFGR